MRKIVNNGIISLYGYSKGEDALGLISEAVYSYIDENGCDPALVVVTSSILEEISSGQSISDCSVGSLYAGIRVVVNDNLDSLLRWDTNGSDE